MKLLYFDNNYWTVWIVQCVLKEEGGGSKFECFCMLGDLGLEGRNGLKGSWDRLPGFFLLSDRCFGSFLCLDISEQQQSIQNFRYSKLSKIGPLPSFLAIRYNEEYLVFKKAAAVREMIFPHRFKLMLPSFIWWTQIQFGFETQQSQTSSRIFKRCEKIYICCARKDVLPTDFLKLVRDQIFSKFIGWLGTTRVRWTKQLFQMHFGWQWLNFKQCVIDGNK